MRVGNERIRATFPAGLTIRAGVAHTWGEIGRRASLYPEIWKAILGLERRGRERRFLRGLLGILVASHARVSGLSWDAFFLQRQALRGTG